MADYGADPGGWKWQREQEKIEHPILNTVQSGLSDEDRELLIGMYIQLSRVLDALYVIAGPEQGKKLNDMHTRGELLSSDPFLKVEDDDDQAV